MRFLADEGVDGLIVAAGPDDRHDVRWMAEELGGTKDSVVLEAAVLDARILITEDKDFGERVGPVDWAGSSFTGGTPRPRQPWSASLALRYTEEPGYDTVGMHRTMARDAVDSYHVCSIRNDTSPVTCWKRLVAFPQPSPCKAHGASAGMKMPAGCA